MASEPLPLLQLIDGYEDDQPIVKVAYAADASIFERFTQFHYHNPHVYRMLVKTCRYVRRTGIQRLGIADIFERLRWFYRFETVGEPFRLNNSFRSFYARLIMVSEPDLADFFETRTSQADGHFTQEEASA